MHAGHAPTPFTAAEIREGCPRGRTMRLRVEPEGGEPYEREIRFAEVDADGAVQAVRRLDAEGGALGDPVTHRSSWLDLQAHASYPAAVTSIQPAALDLAFGTYDCLRYTVRDDDGEERYWFARALPGMPVRYESRRDGAVVACTEMVDNRLEAG